MTENPIRTDSEKRVRFSRDVFGLAERAGLDPADMIQALAAILGSMSISHYRPDQRDAVRAAILEVMEACADKTAERVAGRRKAAN